GNRILQKEYPVHLLLRYTLNVIFKSRSISLLIIFLSSGSEACNSLGLYSVKLCSPLYPSDKPEIRNMSTIPGGKFCCRRMTKKGPPGSESRRSEPGLSPINLRYRKSVENIYDFHLLLKIEK